jgi:hypothetical protein
MTHPSPGHSVLGLGQPFERFSGYLGTEVGVLYPLGAEASVVEGSGGLGMQAVRKTRHDQHLHCGLHT